MDELELLGERIAEQSAHLDAAMHRLLADLRAFDQRGGWHRQGARSCAHWLSWRVGWGLVAARDHVRVAHKLGELPAIDDALARGEISYSKVRAIVRVATPSNADLLLEYARLMPAAHLEKTCRKYALVLRHGQDPRPQDDEQRRYLRRRDTEDGMVKIEAVLHPDEAELVWAMLDHAAIQLADSTRSDSAEALARRRLPVITALTHPSLHAANDSAESFARTPLAAVTAWHMDPSPEVADDSAESLARPAGVLQQQADAARRAFCRADALVSLAQGYLRGDQPHRAPIEVTLTIPRASLGSEPVDIEGAGQLGDAFVSQPAARRLSCDASVVEVVEDEHGTPLSVGRKHRTIAGALKRALRTRDTACTYPGCANRLFLEGHHVQHWADGGETSLTNLTLLCSFHHRFVHEYGYTIELAGDQRPRFRDPRGRLIADVPPRPANTALGWPAIRAANASFAIDADTLACEWDGKPVDYATVIDHLVAADGREARNHRATR